MTKKKSLNLEKNKRKKLGKRTGTRYLLKKDYTEFYTR